MLIVIFYHAGTPFFSGGYIGVDIFFVLSGFLISSLIAEEFNQTNGLNLKRFYIRRMLRLAPALLALVIVFTVSSNVFLSSDTADSNNTEAMISLLYMTNWSRAFEFGPSNYLGHTWSLAIEQQFYIVWPLLLFIILRFSEKQNATFYALAFATSCALIRIYFLTDNTSIERVYNGLDTRFDALMTGSALGLFLTLNGLTETTESKLRKISPYLIWTGIITIAVATATITRGHFFTYFQLGLPIIEIATAAAILGIYTNNSSHLSKILTNKYITWIGTISYGLYLWHYPIFRLMRAFNISGIIIITFGLAAAVAASAISFYSIEKYFLNLGKQKAT